MRFDLSIMERHTIADALTAWALSPTSNETRIREVIGALRAIDYAETAECLDRIQENRRSAAVELIESYTVRS